MKEMTPFDDIDFTRDGTRTFADATFYVGWGGQWYGLDLTSAHAQDLEGLLAPFMAMAERVDKVPPRLKAAPGPAQLPGMPAVKAPARAEKVKTFQGVLLRHAVGMSGILYWEGVREYAERVRHTPIMRQGNQHNWYYPRQVVADYEQWRDKQDALQAKRDAASQTQQDAIAS